MGACRLVALSPLCVVVGLRHQTGGSVRLTRADLVPTGAVALQASRPMTALRTSPDGAPPPPSTPDEESDAAAPTLFAVTWAMAGLFHLWGNVGRVSAFPALTAQRAGQALVAAAAIAVLRRPSDLRRLVALATAGLWTVWLEAPMLSNHWLVAGFVNLAVLGAAVAMLVRRRALDPAPFWALAAPAIRLALLVFYAFAAFAKLNRDFFDPAVSCGALFSSETARSIGLGAVTDAGGRGLAAAIIVAAVVIELSVPILLVMRRTRHAGVVVGLVFHFFLALDLSHQFIDFSALLTALFLLFLPLAFAPWLLQRLRAVPTPVARTIGGAAVVVTALAFLPKSHIGDVVFIGGREVLWLLVSAPLLVAVVRWLPRTDAMPLDRALATPGRWMLLVPALVLLNGLTPYLELKSAFGFTMYSNLRATDGQSNHLIIRRTLPLTDVSADVVRIEGSSDAGLRAYGTTGYGITWHQLRAYAADHPTVAIRYIRRGAVHDLAHASDDPALVAPISALFRKVAVFRAVDLRSHERCQPTWGVAR